MKIIKSYYEHYDQVREIRDLGKYDKDMFISCSEDMNIKIWSAVEDASLKTIKFNCQINWIEHLYNLNKAYISVSLINTILIMNFEKLKVVKIIDLQEPLVKEHSNPRNILEKRGLKDKMSLVDEFRLRTIGERAELEIIKGYSYNSKVSNLIYVTSMLYLSNSISYKNHLLSAEFPNNSIKLWRIDDKAFLKTKFIRKYNGHQNKINCMILLRDQDVFATSSNDKSIKIWNVNKDVCIHNLWNMHKENINWILYYEDQKNENNHFILSGGDDYVLKVIDLNKLKSPNPKELKATNKIWRFICLKYCKSYRFAFCDKICEKIVLLEPNIKIH